jgi:hypothetical protein
MLVTIYQTTWHHTSEHRSLNLTITVMLGPANQSGCIILCVDNLVDEKFLAFNEVTRMKILRTVVHRLTELLPNHCQHRGNLYHTCNYTFK